MLSITEKVQGTPDAQDRLELPFELRQKSRLRCRLASGEEAALFLDRGTLLRGGDRLRASDGRIVEVIAAVETVSVVLAPDPSELARAAYHLGNRHVAVQIGAGWLRYLHDHVLDDMLHGMGFDPVVGGLPFEPEGGAYSQSAHGAGHAHHAPHEDPAAHHHA
jgi:urease accessory protein